MQKLLSLFWLVLLGTLVYGYYNWVTDYNKALDKWQPLVAQCSQHGGFMNSTGTCEIN